MRAGDAARDADEFVSQLKRADYVRLTGEHNGIVLDEDCTRLIAETTYSWQSLEPLVKYLA